MVEILKQHNKAAAKKLDALTAEQLDAMDDAALAALLDMSDLAKKYGVAGDVNGDGDHDDDSGMDVSTLLVVDNVPVVDESKEEKLVSVLRKLFAKSGGKVKEGGAGLFMPMAEEKGGKKMSRGFLFLDCETTADAEKILKAVDNYKLDKAHVLAVNRFADVEKILATPNTYQPPKKEPYRETEQLNSWLMDERARDQFVTLFGDEGAVLWNNKGEEPEVAHEHAEWTDTYLQWSARGLYLATFHRQGVALWGGPSWQRINRYVHPNVKFADFSPCDRYLVTWSNEAIGGGGKKEKEHLRIWDIQTGNLLRGFSCPDSKTMEWPFFRWSHDGSYIARQLAPTAKEGPGIAVYALPDLKLVDGKPMTVAGLKEFVWSPGNNYIAYWTPEEADAPARVTVVDVATRAIVRTKNFFMVSDCKLSWQNNGDYLLVKVETQTKTKKTTHSAIEVFCMRQKDVPIEVFDEGIKDLMIQSVAWEPHGSRFVMVAGNDQRMYIGVYAVDQKAGIKELKFMERKNVNTVYWSPKGHIFVLAGMRNLSGDLEWWDADDLALPVGTGEHFQATDVEWDPTGRYLVSSLSFWRHPTDTGYILWDFKGQMLMKKTIQAFKQLLWRPRPPSMLTKEQMKKIRRNLKEYSVKFAKEDVQNLGAAAQQVMATRKKIRDEWNAWRAQCDERYAAQREERAKLRGGDGEPVYSDVEDEDEDGEEMVEEWTEEVIEETEEVVVE